MKVRFALALALAPCLLTPTIARADAPNHDKASAAFEEARRLIAGGDCRSAIAKLNESLAYEASVGARLSLADCYEQTDPLEAWTQLRDAELLAFTRHDDRVEVAHNRAAALAAKLPSVHLIIPSEVLDTAGVEVHVDGDPVDRYFCRDGILAMKPGEHLFEVTTPRRRWAERAFVQPGTTLTLTVRLDEEATSPGTPPAPPVAASTMVAEGRDPGTTQRSLALVIGGVGAAALATGAIFGVIALDRRSSIEIACGGNPGDCAATPGSLDQEQSSAKTAATISTVAFVAGGTAIGGAVALYFTAPKGPTMRLAPTVGGASLSGAW
jgi:hypothetical protein